MESGSAAAGGVMHNENGDWVFGYNQFLGKCLVFDAEFWGILDDLKLIQQRGHDKVIIQLDNLEVIKAIHRSAKKISNSAVIRRIHHVLSQEGQ
ncbi:hypothetical protein CXB51_036362 [Gossypium anomalum]|uniref:RNase H type-1 domain-containing protein n=1 Tax=Gossypium anomalum TaxID=47600 RepID=A0A8J5XLU5_9ROSI|nr:hypothetical protein CXB51_036362 [Gossypium anomalum]